jgi:hypothetical protein
MKIKQNERGAALILVLFLVAIIGVLSAPVILSMNQGVTNTVKGETAEQAYYTAETGALIANRILYEAVERNKINMSPANITRLVTDLNAQGNLLYNGTIKATRPTWNIPNINTVTNDCSSGFQLSADGTSTRAHINSTKEVILTLKCTQGSGTQQTTSVYTDPATGIFGVEGVGIAMTPAPSGNPTGENKLSTPSGTNIALNKTVNNAQYTTQFTTYFNEQMATRPLPKDPLTPLIPFPVALSGNTLSVNYRQPVLYDSTLNIVPASYALTPGTRTVNSSQGTSVLSKGNITISGNNQTITIAGDLVSGGDIILDCGTCIINVTGNMVAKNEIRMSNWNETINITGNMVSGGRMTFNTVALLSVGKSISSLKNIDFTNTLERLNVSDSVIVGTPDAGNDGIKFSSINELKINGYFSSLTAINFSNTLGNIAPPNKVGLSIIAGKDFIISGFTRLDVGKSISSLTKVNFSNILDTINVLDGSIISGGDIVFNAVKNLNVAGDISSKAKINFSNTIEFLKMTGSGSILSSGETVFNAIKDLTMSGSISTPSNINFSNTIEKMAMTGSIYSGGTLTFNAITNMDTGNIYATTINTNNTITDLDITGSILTLGSLNFQSIGSMTVTNYMGAIGNINFNNGIGNTPKPLLGGITSGGSINFPSWAQWDNNSWINLQYTPPANATSSGNTSTEPATNPTISVGSFSSTRK